MRLPIQAEVIVYRDGPVREFLMLKRPEERGGFWQPVTGGVENGERVEDAAMRELLEETGFSDPLERHDFIFEFQFFADGKAATEYVFAVKMPSDAEPELTEHEEHKWCSLDEAQDLVPREHDEVRQALRLAADL